MGMQACMCMACGHGLACKKTLTWGGCVQVCRYVACGWVGMQMWCMWMSWPVDARGDDGQGVWMCCMQMGLPVVCRHVACGWAYLRHVDWLHEDWLCVQMGCMQMGLPMVWGHVACRWACLHWHADADGGDQWMRVDMLACRHVGCKGRWIKTKRRKKNLLTGHGWWWSMDVGGHIGLWTCWL